MYRTYNRLEGINGGQLENEKYVHNEGEWANCCLEQCRNNNKIIFFIYIMKAFLPLS